MTIDAFRLAAIPSSITSTVINAVEHSAHRSKVVDSWYSVERKPMDYSTVLLKTTLRTDDFYGEVFLLVALLAQNFPSLSALDISK